MSTGKLVGQFSRGDFFGVLPGGFYIFFVGYCALHALEQPRASLWDMIDSLARTLRDKPLLIVFVLFATYLLGSIFRALPVGWAERVIPPFTVHFPYPRTLARMLGNLRGLSAATLHPRGKMPILREDTEPRILVDVFNYWKNTLCIKEPEAFLYYQTFELRARLFAGMFWASLVGTVASIGIIRVAWPWSEAGATLGAVSLLLLIIFGSNFRRVRRHEARALLSLFIAHSK